MAARTEDSGKQKLSRDEEEGLSRDEEMHPLHDDEYLDALQAKVAKMELSFQKMDKMKAEMGQVLMEILGLPVCPLPGDRVLGEVSFRGIADYLKSDKCKNVVTVAGAGMSTSAGIPDFRTPGSGLYDNLDKYNLPNPTAIFQLKYFKENAEPFWKMWKELWSGNYKPTPSHYFIKLLHDKGKLLRHFTQNIDDLDIDAGIPQDKIVQAHGTMRISHCTDCGEEYSHEWVKEKIFADEIPCCHSCNGQVKPDIVFFGERLPPRFFTRMTEDMAQADLLIILGTSLSVQPFANLPKRVPASTPRLLINLDRGNSTKTPGMSPAMLMMSGGGCLDFDSVNNFRDVFHQSECDAGCYELSDMLGWRKELLKMTS